jgi:hypothetical protein
VFQTETRVVADVGDITDAANTQDTWLSNFAERNLDWKKLMYNRYNDFLKALDSSGRVREMIKQHHTAQQRKTKATKKLGNLRQHYPKLQAILSDSTGSEKWMRITAIPNQTSRDPGLAKRCLNLAYVNRLTKLNRKSKVNMWYTSRDFQEAKTLFDKGCPQLEEGINYEAMGLKLYRGLVMPLSYYLGMDDCNNANRFGPSHLQYRLPTIGYGRLTMEYRLPTMGDPYHLHLPIRARLSHRQHHESRVKKRKMMTATLEGF